MKKLFLLFFALGTTIQGFSQITFEHEYLITKPDQEIIFLTDLGNNNYKYVLWDMYHDWFSLYNIDHTPFMLNIQLPVTTDSGRVYAIGYITNTLFDCDSTNIEYALMSYGGGDAAPFLVYRTDGALLFSKDSVTVPWGLGYNVGSVEIHGITNTNVGTKLMLFNATNTIWQVYVYALCGKLPESIAELNLSADYVKVSPIPAMQQITFNVMPPGNLEDYELVISNAQFQIIRTTAIQGGMKREFNLNCETLNSGTYFYALQSKNKILQTGKFIITK